MREKRFRCFTLGECIPCPENLWMVVRKAFMSTEVVPCPENLWKIRRRAFTLAEVLITLAIIGVVAALTIPTLMAKINQKVSENRQTTIEARLLDGINRYSAMEDGLSKPYETTYDFLVGLSKFYKMSQICKADEITNCVPYDVINYEKNGAPATVEVKSLKSVETLLTDTVADKYLAPASFITAQGTPVIMAFKKDCVWDMGKAMRSIQDSGCIAYMYDESGTRLPNKYGKDIISHGLTITGKGVPIATVNGVKIMEQAFFPSVGLTKAECEAEIAGNYGITACNHENDLWAAGMKYCHDKGWRLPNEAECGEIGKGLYKDRSGNPPSNFDWSGNYILDSDLVSSIDFKNIDGSSYRADYSHGRFWTSYEMGASFARQREVRSNGVGVLSSHRDNSDYSGTQVLCISD